MKSFSSHVLCDCLLVAYSASCAVTTEVVLKPKFSYIMVLWMYDLIHQASCFMICTLSRISKVHECLGSTVLIFLSGKKTMEELRGGTTGKQCSYSNLAGSVAVLEQKCLAANPTSELLALSVASGMST